MNTSLKIALGMVAVFALGMALGFAVRGGGAPTEVAEVIDPQEEADDSADVIAQLRLDLAAAKRREAALRREARSKAPKRAEAVATPKTPTKGKTRTTAAGRRVTLGSPEEANAMMEDFLDRSDLEGLWELAAALLKHGPAGYDKLIALMANLESRGDEFKDSIGALWRSEELFVGRLLGRVGENSEDVLRFLLYTHGYEGELPEMAQDLEREMLDELGPLLLGYYRGSDTELLDGYTDWMESHIREDLGRSRNDAFRALAQIRTPKSRRVLTELLAEVPEKRLPEVVRALAWQGGPQAVAALKQLRADMGDDPRLATVLDAALQYLRAD